MIRTRYRTSARRVIALAAALLAGAAFAQATGEQGMTRRATELREAPSEASRSLGSLPAESLVSPSGERQGGWVKVRSGAGVAGWLHMFDVGPATGTGAAPERGSAAGGALRGVTSLFSPRQPQRAHTATSTIGIRGLGAEDLARAQPNPGAVAQMEALRVNENDARQFASRASLRPANVEPLPAPARAPRSRSGDAAEPGRETPP